jgi:predicted XRE-type DNA-binding protein
MARSLKRLEDKESTLMFSPNASLLDLFRWDLCQLFVNYKQEHDCTRRQLAEKFGADEAKLSKIHHHRIDEFSTDRLIALSERINPNLKLRVG